MIRGRGAAPTSFFLLSSIKSLLLSAVVLVFAVGPASAQLSQNSGIRSNDTWVTLDLTMQIQAPSSSISRPTITYTHHVEIGYDMNGQIVANLWPTGDVSGTTILLTSRVNGSFTNFALSTSYTFDTENFTAPAFTVAASGPTLTGGSD